MGADPPDLVEIKEDGVALVGISVETCTKNCSWLMVSV